MKNSSHIPQSFLHSNCAPRPRFKIMLPSISERTTASVSKNTLINSHISKALQIFCQMEEERKEIDPIHIPIEPSPAFDSNRIPDGSVPYNAELIGTNRNLRALRAQAQEKIRGIIMVAKEDKKLRWKLEKSMQKYQRVRTEANERMGRIGSMKAQRRIIDADRKAIEGMKARREAEGKTSLYPRNKTYSQLF